MKEKLLAFYELIKIPCRMLLCFSGGLIFSLPFLSGSFSPFAVSFAAALDGIFSVAAAVGSAVGFFAVHTGASSFRYFAVLVVSTSALRISLDVFGLRRDNLLKILCPGISTFLINMIYLFSQKFSPTLIAGIAAETALTAAAVPVFAEGVRRFRHKPLKTKPGEEKDVVCLLLLFSTLTAHLKYFDTAGTAALIFLDFMMILYFSYSRDFYGGVAAGICCGFTYALDGSGEILCVIMPMCGCVCDFFELDRYRGAAASFLCAAAGCVISGDISFAKILPAAAASAVFCLLPQNLLYFKAEQMTEDIGSNSFSFSKKAKNLACAVENISDCMSAVRTSLEPFEQISLEKEIEKTREKICSGCELKESCANEIRKADRDFYKKAADAVRSGGIDLTDFSDNFESTCLLSDEMTRKMNEAYFTYRTKVTAQNKIKRIQTLAGSQFKTFGGVIGSACTTLERLGTVEHAHSRELLSSAKEFGLEVKKSDICKDKAGRDYFELSFVKSKDNFSVSELLDKIIKDTGFELDFPTLVQNGSEYTLVFKQKEKLKFNIAAASMPSAGKGVCGDYYRCFKDDAGRQIVLLSDGMGTGGRAAVDSAFTCETVSSLLKAGIDEKTAAAAVNSAMIMKSADESLATVDLLRLDPVLCTAEFFKCGAAPTFIRKGKKQLVLEPESTPIGILDSVNMAAGRAEAEAGDIIVMVSDGVSCERYGWISSEIGAWQSDSAGELARHILTCARDRQLGKRLDDMTVLAIIITE